LTRYCLKKPAERLLKLLFTLDHWNFNYALSLGMVLQMRSIHEAALFCFMRAQQASGTDPRPPYYAGLSYQKIGELDSAKKALTAACQMASEQTAHRQLQQDAAIALQALEP
jgi:secretion system chaperone SscA